MPVDACLLDCLMDTTSTTLLGRLRQPHDQEARSRFVKLYYPLLARYAECLARTRPLSLQDREDLVNDVFLYLLEKLPVFTHDPQKSFRGLLRTILRNRACDLLRRRNCLPITDREPSFLEVSTQDGAQLLEKEEYEHYLIERAKEVMKADFDQDTWQAVWENVVKERSAADVARQFGRSVEAIYAARYRILRRLREERAGLLEE
jgi:RNA polymerase sigma-70 factor (ECF subfamily)